jgi:DNA-binding MarR family transcriptional regulator
MAVFWRVLHLFASRYGSHPVGQVLVVLTLIFLNDRGMPPTMMELCKATGRPKGSVSRYVSSQIKQGFVKEVVDPNDRRRRLLKQTRKGKSEWNWQVRQMDRLFDEIFKMDGRFRVTGDQRSATELLDHMEGITKGAPKRRHKL